MFFLVLEKTLFYQDNSCDVQIIELIIWILGHSWETWCDILYPLWFLVRILLGDGSRLNKLVYWRSWGYDMHLVLGLVTSLERFISVGIRALFLRQVWLSFIFFRFGVFGFSCSSWFLVLVFFFLSWFLSPVGLGFFIGRILLGTKAYWPNFSWS